MGNIRITFDSLTPGLKRMEKLGASPKAVLEVGAVELKNMTVEAFGDPSARPAAWPNKKDGSPSDLTDSTTLRQSITQGAISNTKAEVATDRLYAAVHQFGYAANNIPARPFFPFVNNTPTPEAHARIEAIMRLKLNNLLKAATR
jgi:phage gpG-like protein